jgi:hypothetical protein
MNHENEVNPMGLRRAVDHAIHRTGTQLELEYE